MKKLSQITRARPYCECCDKPLKPVTAKVQFKGELDAPPDVEIAATMEPPEHVFWTGALAVQNGYLPERVYRLEYKTGSDDEPFTELYYWNGTYAGYGCVTEEDGLRTLFCTQMCAVRFAVGSWNAGMRMARNEGAVA
jgi:hypothetical protein